jgi:hypothetical protein
LNEADIRTFSLEIKAFELLFRWISKVLNLCVDFFNM